MNTKVVYLYRSGANDKFYGEHILAGVPAMGLEAFEQALKACCECDGQFIASQVGVAERFPWEIEDGFAYDDEIDHCFHELEAVEQCEAAPTDAASPEEFLSMFKTAHSEGWMIFDPMFRNRVRV